MAERSQKGFSHAGLVKDQRRRDAPCPGFGILIDPPDTPALVRLPKPALGCEKTQVAEDVLPTVELFSRPGCHLCEEAKTLLQELQAKHSFLLCEVDISTRADLLERYGEEIPVVFINGRKAFKYRVDPRQFVRGLRRAQPRRWRLPWVAGSEAAE